MNPFSARLYISSRFWLCFFFCVCVCMCVLLFSISFFHLHEIVWDCYSGFASSPKCFSAQEKVELSLISLTCCVQRTSELMSKLLVTLCVRCGSLILLCVFFFLLWFLVYPFFHSLLSRSPSILLYSFLSLLSTVYILYFFFLFSFQNIASQFLYPFHPYIKACNESKVD